MQLQPEISPVLVVEERIKGMELEMASVKLAYTEHVEKTKAESERIDDLEKQLAAFKVASSMPAVRNHLLTTRMARLPPFRNQTTIRPEPELRLPTSCKLPSKMPRLNASDQN
jgi:hypothetical protein